MNNKNRKKYLLEYSKSIMLYQGVINILDSNSIINIKDSKIKKKLFIKNYEQLLEGFNQYNYEYMLGYFMHLYNSNLTLQRILKKKKYRDYYPIFNNFNDIELHKEISEDFMLKYIYYIYTNRVLGEKMNYTEEMLIEAEKEFVSDLYNQLTENTMEVEYENIFFNNKKLISIFQDLHHKNIVKEL